MKLGVNPNSDKEKIVTNPQKHTPGPWRWVREGPALYLIGEGGSFTSPIIDDGSAHGEYWPHIASAKEPDACLIEAAPDMLAALKGVANMVQSSLPPCIRAPVEAAIMKAEGK